jgi:predicted metal-dependent TIM-barrel fold hydrolase
MYTKQMKQAIRSIDAPKDFEISIFDYDKFLAIQFYESHWRHLSEKERFRCMQYMVKIKTILESLGASVTLDPILDIKYNDERKL